MISQYLSNYLFDALVVVVGSAVIFVFLVAPRLHGRRTYNWIVRRVAKIAPRAAVTKSGKWLRRNLIATWDIVIGPEGNTSVAQLQVMVSPVAPYRIGLFLVQEEEYYHVADFVWKTWAPAHFVHYAHWYDLKRSLGRAVRICLDLRARRRYPSAETMAKAAEDVFGLPLSEIVSI